MAEKIKKNNETYGLEEIKKKLENGEIKTEQIKATYKNNKITKKQIADIIKDLGKRLTSKQADLNSETNEKEIEKIKYSITGLSNTIDSLKKIIEENKKEGKETEGEKKGGEKKGGEAEKKVSYLAIKIDSSIKYILDHKKPITLIALSIFFTLYIGHKYHIPSKLYKGVRYIGSSIKHKVKNIFSRSDTGKTKEAIEKKETTKPGLTHDISCNTEEKCDKEKEKINKDFPNTNNTFIINHSQENYSDIDLAFINNLLNENCETNLEKCGQELINRSIRTEQTSSKINYLAIRSAIKKSQLPEKTIKKTIEKAIYSTGHKDAGHYKNRYNKAIESAIKNLKTTGNYNLKNIKKKE